MEGKRKNQHKEKGGNKRKKTANFSKYSPLQNKTGILVTCDRDKEKRSMAEISNLCAEYFEKLYPVGAQGKEEKEQKTSSLTIEQELNQEIAELKETKNSVFGISDTGVSGTYFVSVHKDYKQQVDIVHFVKTLFNDIQASKVPKTRFTHRLIPVQRTCVATMTEIDPCARSLITPILGPNLPSKKFCILFTHRNNDELDRKEVTSMVDMSHTVDLKNPEWVIIVECLRKTCCLTVTSEYFHFKKFNIRLILGADPVKPTERKPTPPEQDDKKVQENEEQQAEEKRAV